MKFFAAAPVLLSVLPAVLAGGRPKPYCPPTKVSESRQRAIWNEFVQTFYINKQFVAAAEKHYDDSYIQHNPDFLSGKQNAIEAFKGFPTTNNITLLHRAFENGYGWVHYRLDITGAGQPFALVDVLRMNGSCIMEHWDVLQQRPENPKNPLALF